MEFVFDWDLNKENVIELKEVIKSYRYEKGALMPVLHEAQRIFGYLPIEVQGLISEGLNISLSEIYGVVTFYSQFTLVPKGKFKIGVCLGTACYVKGSQAIIDEIKKELQIEVGQTTSNKKFSLEATRCIGACGLAPVMTINDDVYGRLKAEEVADILNKYKEIE